MPGMRRLAAVLAALAAWSAGAAEPAVTGTLRVDYFHTGGQGVEIFAVDQVVLEPLPWPGHPARTVEVAETGSYRFEVRSADGTLVFSRGFSSIFGEWVTTAEAAASDPHQSLACRTGSRRGNTEDTDRAASRLMRSDSMSAGS